MAFGELRNSVRSLLVLLFFWTLCACAYRQPSLKPASEEPPPPADIKIETPAHPKLETTVHRKPATPAQPKPETLTQPKPETNVVLPKKYTLKIQPSPLPTSGFFSHKVRWPEETLSHVAQWYTGTVKNWKVIAKANPGLDPKKIAPGDIILIPKDLLTSRKPLPFSFLHPLIHKKAKLPPSHNKKATPSDSPNLFGPIDTELPPKESSAAKLFGPLE